MSSPSSSRKRSSPDSNIQGGGGAAEDERKLKRKLSNKESARRSRQRKQQELADLHADYTRFTAENARAEAQIAGYTDKLAKAQIAAYTDKLAKVDAENAELRALHGELAGKLQDLEDVLEMLQVSGPAVDNIPEIPVDPPLCPWQSPFAQQLAAATAMADAFPF